MVMRLFLKKKTNRPGTVKLEFKLEKGKKLFKRIENAKGTTTKATKNKRNAK
ncbi:MAG: hypothetical protein KatS3mg028_1488 [Bacteroidia bacterium]|nr:MAG: hypothetical protein KatS3mg028_1488 [Bacteroidia bacterium]